MLLLQYYGMSRSGPSYGDKPDPTDPIKNAVDYGNSIDSTQNLDYMQDLLKDMSAESGGVADQFRSHAYTGIGKTFDKALAFMSLSF